MTKKARQPEARPRASQEARPRASQDELLEAARELIAEADALLSSKRPPTDRFRDAVDKLRALVPEAAPPPAKRVKPGAPLTQEDWDARVLEWASNVDRPITLERAFAALAPESATGSSDHSAIAASLNRLPRDRFTFSWYMAGTALAPMWTKAK